jgi:ribonuclease III
VDLFRQQQLLDLLARLGFSAPNDIDCYDHALTHSSFSYEYRLSPLSNYERLEFLGDAVLKMIASAYLYERFPDYREGQLTKIRAVIVSDAQLAQLANKINLGSVIVFGPSEARNGGFKKVSNLACAFEALLGAFFLDGKMDETKVFLEALLEELVTQVDSSKTKDNFKAVLQELTQADGDGLPLYRTVSETGPSHERLFTVEVLVRHEVVGIGVGKSKKEAQQLAAKQAMAVFNQLED